MEEEFFRLLLVMGFFGPACTSEPLHLSMCVGVVIWEARRAGSSKEWWWWWGKPSFRINGGSHVSRDVKVVMNHRRDVAGV